MKRSIIKTVCILAALLMPAAALAKPLVKIGMSAEKETVTVENGRKLAKRVKAEKVTPGDIIFYTLTYTNAGDETATNVAIDNPVPQGTVYLPDSATGHDADITFSIDGGKSYKKASLLTYEVKLSAGKLEKRVASPEEYTHIRWVVRTVPAGASGKVGFQVRVK